MNAWLGAGERRGVKSFRMRAENEANIAESLMITGSKVTKLEQDAEGERDARKSVQHPE